MSGVAGYGQSGYHACNEINRSSTMLITDAVMELYERIVDKNLLIRRINITANRLVDENSAKKEDKYEQLDLFTDYKAKEQEKSVCSRQCLR